MTMQVLLHHKDGELISVSSLDDALNPNFEVFAPIEHEEQEIIGLDITEHGEHSYAGQDLMSAASNFGSTVIAVQPSVVRAANPIADLK